MMSSTSSSIAAGLSCYSREWIPSFKSTSSSFVSVTRNPGFFIEAVQSPSQNPRRRRPQNVEGDIFVDSTCIDCDTCRWMAPQVFNRVDGMSAVVKQPKRKEERLKALQALLSCPTGSIRTEANPPDILEAQKTFPLPIDEDRLPGVFHCGYHSEKSYGASSYLILHPEGNILVDSPRYTKKLADKIEMFGGVRYMFLTHKDDVADHAKWAERFTCTRILHSTEVQSTTADVEMKLEGVGPWRLYKDIFLMHTPGHSEGSVCLFHRTIKALFTGDHIGMTESGLSIFEQYNSCSVPQQLESVRKLLDLDFMWILPGHGRRVCYRDSEKKNADLETLIQKYKHVSP